MGKNNRSNEGADGTACADLPELKRLNYFHGQMLGAHDLRTEQAYFREKIKLHNRCLHGYGTVCGLKLATVPAARDCAGDGEQGSGDRHQGRLVLEAGLALDCEGNEIIVPRPYVFDPWHLLSPDDRSMAETEGGVDLYLSICHCEQPADPVRPVLANACGATPECSHGKLRDTFRLRLSSDQPPADTRCETCCTCCADACLLLARICGFRKDAPPRSIDNGVRRLVAADTYPPTTITGISWVHGATYTPDEAARLIGSPGGESGIEVTFSRPVLASTLRTGVVDLWVIEGGHTRNAGVYYLEGQFDEVGGAPAVASFRFTYQGDERLNPGDRLMITIRCAFILDQCCRPVDGAHVGGMVPLVAGREQPDPARADAPCGTKPPGYGPWTSGAGTPGSTFESWIFIKPYNDNQKGGNKEDNK